MKPRLAVVGFDHQVHTMDVDGGQHRQVTVSLAANPLLVWGRPDLTNVRYGWPCWDPSGRRIACIETRVPREGGTVHAIHVIEGDGEVEREVATSTHRVPLYVSWQPQGHGLAVLHQVEDHLELFYCDLETGGSLRRIERGGPLFFTWAPDGRTLFVHAATPEGRRQGRLVACDALGEHPDLHLPDEPGNYCNPIVVGDRLVHVIRNASAHHLVSTDREGGDRRILLEFMGLGAIVPAGPGAVLFTVAPRGEGSPYRGLTRFDIGTGAPRRLADRDISAVFHHGARNRTVFAAPEEDEPWIAWWLCDPPAPPRRVARFVPSREQVFHLHFFEQFHDSHPPISPDGRWLTWAGRSMVDGKVPGTDRIWTLDLDGEGGPRELLPGRLAVFQPEPPAV